jgi:hypothetical protein
MPLYVVAVYSKGEVLKLTKREERELSGLAEALVAERRKPLRGRTN